MENKWTSTLKCGDSKESPYLTADWEEPPASDKWLDFIATAGEVLTGVPAAKILPMAKKCYARSLANEFLPFETMRRVRVECSAYRKEYYGRNVEMSVMKPELPQELEDAK
jgi:hypothetical protein